MKKLTILSVLPVAVIYNFISETWRQGTLVENENLRQIYLGYIQETTKYLSQPATESILDNHQVLGFFPRIDLSVCCCPTKYFRHSPVTPIQFLCNRRQRGTRAVYNK